MRPGIEMALVIIGTDINDMDRNLICLCHGEIGKEFAMSTKGVRDDDGFALRQKYLGASFAPLMCNLDGGLGKVKPAIDRQKKSIGLKMTVGQSIGTSKLSFP